MMVNQVNGWFEIFLVVNHRKRYIIKKFSIVIPTYNSEKYIAELLNTLVNQEFPKDEFEVIAVDDYSTDNTVKVLDQYLDKVYMKI